MRVYAVMRNLSTTTARPLAGVAYPNVLVSFMFDPERILLDRLGYRPERLFLDSGAFSVWSNGKTVDREAYADWALAYSRELPCTVASLDVIPGEPGRTPTASERRRAVAQGMNNADYLRSRGLKVTEAYHRFEPLTVLDKLVERRQPGEVMAIGGLVGGRDRGAKITFCDGAFARLRDLCNGWTRLVPVHGFGLGPDGTLARRYPWFSIDSTTWFRGVTFPQEREPGFPIDRMTPAMGALHFRRLLSRWQEEERTLTGIWESRGVRYAT